MGRLTRITGPALLFSFGLAVSLTYGRRGFMPLDHSIVFDGGWRILCGQIPFRDYVAPNGFVVHALQALFFAVGGVNWLSYCLHAAVVNGLFAVLVDRILRQLGMASVPALVYGALSALVLYPPLGVPYMDAHAFFFSAVGVWMALLGRSTETRSRAIWPWLLLPLVMTLAALAKQIPSAFVLPIVLAIALAAPAPLARRRLLLLLAGSVAVVATLASAAVALGVDWDLVSAYYFQLPGAEARLRLAGTSPPLAETLSRLDLGSIGSVCVVFLGATALAVRNREPFWPALLAQCLLLASFAYSVVTLNQAEIAVAYLFLAAGLAQLALGRASRALEAWPRLRLTARALAAGVLALAVWDGVHFSLRVNATRTLNDIQWDAETAARAAPTLHPALSFMGWQVPRVVPYDADQLTETANFLASQPRGFLLIGDASVLYGLTGKASAAPSLWFHPGLTVPQRGSEQMSDYEDLLLERIATLDVRYLVLEGRQTWNHLTVGHFPRIAAMVRREGIARRIGAFGIVDLSASGGASPAASQVPVAASSSSHSERTKPRSGDTLPSRVAR